MSEPPETREPQAQPSTPDGAPDDAPDTPSPSTERDADAPHRRAAHDTAADARRTTPEPTRRPALGPRTKTRPARARSASPVRWQTIQATAVLASVAAHNFVCFGSGGVPRYGVQPSDAPAPESFATLCAELFLRSAAGDLRLAHLDLHMECVERTTERVTWRVYDPVQRLQVYWVWDFYRIQSTVVVRVAEPRPGTAEPGAEWAAALDAVRAAHPGDMLTLTVRSRCGDIRQDHPLTQPAAPWLPG